MQWDYWRLLTVLSLAGFAGLIVGHMMTFLFVATLIYVFWLQSKWFQLRTWLEKPKKNSSPQAEGVIDDVCRQIEQMRAQNSSRKKKLTGYLKRFQSATAALPDAVVVMGEFGQVSWANTSATELLGISWPRDNGVRVNNLVRDPTFQHLLEIDSDASAVVVAPSPMNDRIQLEFKVVRYASSDRLLIARDITQTQKLQRMRRDFVANVSHELRTPLTVLRGYLETLDTESDPDLWRQALPVMQQQSQRMHLMIKDLLALSQLETGDKPLLHRPTDIPRLLTVIVDDAKRLEHYKAHQIHLQIDSNKWLMADVDELRSAISNLIFNAVKYTPAECKIEVVWAVSKNVPTISVIDHGEGIEARHLERLTERFYRVDSGRSREAGGTGLGLAIVKHVLQRHNAVLTIDSQIGQGSTFCCIFPENKLVEPGDT
ncbi:phosphate regulon sensor histidine kinase PhoR [Methylophaga pinxianii]|uniref:phosphate regulon sensor histidine kinase PhoR n=1 Tax=Methylophaga pinxianii TaxID=2881052 RepID=UPI001CF5F869|nr:phosphate regulon sensor histidine kinase PhoR [Methylophaga pinxianii]MCB2428003.1 phosphate regulon sensor histidine kinase PhoR [Methylophaga pinxianii]UPH46119.1 phosphate regulon sensor histidine kinase PhoR [Methylophaga pinxianii]